MTSREDIINGSLDLYGFLKVDPTANSTQIKRQYRKIALLYHPDKNDSADAADKFQLLSIVYEILSDANLRQEYDSIRNYKADKKAKENELNEQTRRFRDQLLRQEQDAIKVFDSVNNETNLEKLREDGIKRRRLMELQKPQTPAYKSYKDIKVDQHFNLVPDVTNTKVIIKWKHRPELEELPFLDILKEIMTVFGPIVNIKEIKNTEDKYKAALIEFLKPENADIALSHDYRKTASLWDGTEYRKLASLLRECKLFNADFGESISPEEQEKYKDILTNNQDINKAILKYVRSVSDSGK